MKKTIPLLIMSIPLLSSGNTVYNSIITKSYNEYEVGGFKTIVEDSGWYDVGQPVCVVDILPEDIYFDRDFNQTENCTQEQEKTITTKRVWDGGGEEIVKVEKYTQEIEEENVYALVGTHTESSCYNILQNNYSIGNGVYRITNGLDVQCDMNNGGFTLLFNHDISSGYFANATQASNSNTGSPSLNTGKYSILYKLEDFRRNGKFEFKIAWKGYSKINIWKQSSNPTYQTVSGYEGVYIQSTSNYWGGLEVGNSGASYMDGSVNHTNWYYSIGSYVSWGNGIPASDHVAGSSVGVPNVNLWIK